jgi:hypothetical protein
MNFPQIHHQPLFPPSFCLDIHQLKRLLLNLIVYQRYLKVKYRVLIFKIDFSLLDLSHQSNMPTHFDMTNPNDWVLAYSLVKTSVVQIERTSSEDLLRLTNTNRNKLSINSPTSNIIIDDMPRVRGPKSTRYTCPICGLITVSMERLQRHVNQHGQKLRLETYKPERKVSSLVCEKCKATFSSAYALRKHQRVHTRGLFLVFLYS